MYICIFVYYSAVVRNLGSDLDIKEIYIKAMNRADIVGEAGYLDNRKGVNPNPQTIMHTNPSSMFSQLRKELHEASKMTEDYIETDFLNGVTQRILRIEFMREVNARLKKETPDPVEQHEQAEWAHIKRQIAAIKKKEEMEAEKLEKMEDFDVMVDRKAPKEDNDDVRELMRKLGEYFAVIFHTSTCIHIYIYLYVIICYMILLCCVMLCYAM